MSRTIDERVVEMRFDNKQFEQNVQTSLSTIEKLKQSLNLTGAAKGLENVSAAAQRCNLSSLSNAVETVKVKFSAFEVMAVTALANITNTAVNAGKRIVEALTIDPIKTGFQEYETQINAVQTILANTSSKGTTLDQVNAALDELNHYADMTIYNFTEMTRNIGTFTAAGVDLETSVSAIKGIANLAAVSGSNSQQASTAMYQLSQALAAGTVKLQDWNSVVNAGMGGQVFQDALKETARVHGIAIDQMITDEGSFRETLQKGWLTSDILTETLAKFTGDLNEDQLRTMGYSEEQIKSIIKMGQTANDAATKVKTFTQLFDTLKEAAQSGWTQSWEIIVGDFEEAKELLTEVSDTFSGLINASADARNKMLQDWKDLGGRTMLIEAVKNAFEGLLSIAKPIREAFNEIFPPMTGQQLADITKKIRDLTENFKISEETSNNLKSTFKGVFAVLDVLKQALTAVTGGIVDLVGAFLPAGGGILSLTASFGEYLVKLDETIKKTDVFNKAVQKVVSFIKNGVQITVDVISTVTTALKQFKDFISEKFDFNGLELLQSILERVEIRMLQVREGAGKMRSGFEVAVDLMGEALEKSNFLKLMEAMWKAVTTIASGIAQAIGTMMKTLTEKLGNARFNGLLDLFNSITAGGVVLAISKFLKSVSEPLKGLQDILDGVTSILDGVRGCFEAYQTQLKAGTLMKIAVAIGILSGSIVALSLIDSDKLSSSLGAITVLFANLLASMAIFNKISDSSGKTVKACTAMISMSIAVSILTGALKKIADLEWEEIGKGLVGIAGLSAIVVASAKIMSSGSGQIVKGATSLVIFATAVKVLASACKDLSVLSWEELGKGLTGVGVLMGEIAIFLRAAKFSGKTITTATGIVILAASMKILASACKDFAVMNWDEIGKGLTSIGLLLGEIAAFTNLAGNAKHVISTGIALTVIGAAMKIFASAVADFAKLQWEEIGRGLTAMGGALAEVAIAVNLMPKNMISIGTGLTIVGAALEILANVMAKFGGMQWDEIGRGLTVLGGALAELAIGLNVMKGTLSGSAAMIVAATALAILTPVLTTLGNQSWEEIVKGLVTLAGAFTILGVAGAVLSPLLPTIIGLAGAFALVGVSVLAIGGGLLAAGTGLSALAVGFTALATAGAAGATAVVASLSVIVTGVAGLIPAVIEQFGYGLISLCRVIAEGAPVIGEAVKAVVLTLVDVIVECAPQIADGAFQLLVSALEILVKYTPQLIDLLTDFLIEVISGITKNMPKLIKVAIESLMTFFSGIIDALKGLDTTTLVKGIAGIGLLSAMMLALQSVAALVPGAMVGILGIGAVVAEMALVLAAVGGLAQLPGLSWLIGEGGKLLEQIGTAIGGFVGGIVGGFMGGISSQFPQIGADLSAFMNNIQPFIEGASRIQPSMLDGVNALAKTVLLLTAADIIQGLTSWFTGGSSLADFGNQLVPFGKAMMEFSNEIAGMDAGLVANAATAGQALAEMATTIPNTGGVISFFTGDNDMATFASQLVPFGRAMKDFSDAVRGMDANLVAEAAIAGQALAEMATTIPNTGGIVSWFTGNNDMDDFANQLVPFGRAMKDFSDAVRGVDPDSIVNSATAGKSLVELANTVPNTGGVVSWFTGDNDMNVFGQNLIPFGRAMKSYSEAITGMDVDAVTNSAVAGQALVELANTLPNTGGIVSWFTGDNDIGAFGESLISFGRNFKMYSDYMVGVDAGIVTATTNAANSIVELSNSLPEKGGWFSGDTTLADFGSDMAQFGSYFCAYYGSISSVDVSLLSGVITQTNRLVDMANGMSELDTSGMVGFSAALTQLGQAGIEGFINSFNNSTDRVTNAATTMVMAFANAANNQKGNITTAFTSLIQAALSAITGKQAQFSLAGGGLMSQFISGVKSQASNSKTAILNIISDCLSVIKNHLQEFHNMGTDTMSKFVSGIKAERYEVSDAFTSGLNEAVSGINGYYNSFYSAGEYLAIGFANGISDNAYYAVARSRAMARRAAEAAAAELDEHSPSKVGYHIGDFFGVAFVNAIGDYEDKAYSAGAGMANSAKTGLKQSVNSISNAISEIAGLMSNDMETQPIIRPVIDLTNIQNGADRIRGLMGGVSGYALTGSLDLATKTQSGIESRKQYTGNNDTLTALDKLAKSIDELLDNPNNSFENTFNISGNNPKEIAEEVSNIIQRQVERRGASWA